MTIPDNTENIDFPTSMMWFDEQGVFCSIAKKVATQTVKEAKISLKKIQKFNCG